MTIGTSLSRPFHIPKINILEPYLRVLEIINRTNDHELIELWNKEEKHCRDQWEHAPMKVVPSYDIPDEINTDLRSWLQMKQEILSPGKPLPRWPSIEVSQDDPPIFKQNPALKRIYEEDLNSIVDCTPDFESLLGCYYSQDKKIVLWRKGIELCARRMGLSAGKQGFSVEKMSRCVLVHELGHWFCDVASVSSGAQWDPLQIEIQVRGYSEELGYLPDNHDATLKGTAWSLSSRSFHEMWAQWFVWLYGHEVDSNVLDVFQKLEERQSRPYHAWRKLASRDEPPTTGRHSLEQLRFSQQDILKSLEWARLLRDSMSDTPLPATFDDRNYAHTNLLDHLCS